MAVPAGVSSAWIGQRPRSTMSRPAFIMAMSFPCIGSLGTVPGIGKTALTAIDGTPPKDRTTRCP